MTIANNAKSLLPSRFDNENSIPLAWTIKTDGNSTNKIFIILLPKAVMPIAVFFSVLTFAVGDLITPNSEKNAQQLKTNATNT